MEVPVPENAGMLTRVSLLWTTGTAGTKLQLHGSCQLFSSSFPRLPPHHPHLRTNQEPLQPERHPAHGCIQKQKSRRR